MGIESIVGHELFVVVGFHDLAVVQDDDLVRPASCGEPVRDHDCHSAYEQLLQRPLKQHLGVVVDVCGGLVQYQNLGVGDECPAKLSSYRCPTLRLILRSARNV